MLAQIGAPWKDWCGRINQPHLVAHCIVVFYPAATTCHSIRVAKVSYEAHSIKLPKEGELHGTR